MIASKLVDYEFAFGRGDIGEVVLGAVQRYNKGHAKPANMVWVGREDYDELVSRRKNGVDIGWNPCMSERGNLMVGRVE